MIADTTPVAKLRQNEIFQRLSGEEKMRLAMAWSNTVRDLAWVGFCRRHPKLSGERLRVMFLRELHGIEMPEESGRELHE